jgi:hypothetical protein
MNNYCFCKSLINFMENGLKLKKGHVAPFCPFE